MYQFYIHKYSHDPEYYLILKSFIFMHILTCENYIDIQLNKSNDYSCEQYITSLYFYGGKFI